MLALIMIGGRGTRFWPLSRAKCPKQLINFTGTGEMIRLTVNRLKPLTLSENFYIITSKDIVSPVKKILPEINNIIGEPEAKNTAPCIALLVGLLLKKEPEQTLGVFPGDHFIQNEQEFVDILRRAEFIAQSADSLVTIGITPEFAHTGYGYIEYDKTNCNNGFYKVIKFYEKPDKTTAEKFLQTGNFLWNAGIFVWKIKTIAAAFEKYQPTIYESILKISESPDSKLTKVIKQEYKKMPKISIDYAIMERSDNIATIPANIGWKDIGSWSALADILPKDKFGNVIFSDANITINSSNNIIHCKNKMVGLINVDNLIVAVDKNNILICKRDADQQVGQLVKKMDDAGMTEFL